MKRSPVLAVVALALLASCRLEDPDAERIEDIEPRLAGAEMGVANPDVDWTDPIGGVPVETVAEAQLLLDFEVLDPSGLGEPTAMFIDLPESPAVIAFVFDSPEYGLVVIKEYRPDVPTADWESSLQQIVADNDAPTRSGRADIVKIRGEESALVTTSEDGSVSSLFFHMGDKEISIRGPNLVFEDVVAIANGL